MLKMNKREKYNDSGKLVFGQNTNELKECCGDFPDSTERSEYIYCKMETWFCTGKVQLLVMQEE